MNKLPAPYLRYAAVEGGVFSSPKSSPNRLSWKYSKVPSFSTLSLHAAKAFVSLSPLRYD